MNSRLTTNNFSRIVAFGTPSAFSPNNFPGTSSGEGGLTGPTGFTGPTGPSVTGATELPV